MLEALMRRLSPFHEKRADIEADYMRRRKGYRGEVGLDYYLKMLPRDDYFILNNLQLRIDDTNFQIDTLIVTKYFAAIVEVKNYSGTLIFEDAFNQFIQELETGELKKYPNPIMQAKRQCHQLQKWMKKFGIKSIPIKYFVAFGNPKAIIKGKHQEVKDVVCDSEQIPEKMNLLSQQFTKSHFSSKELQHFTELLKREHSSEPQNVLKTYSINKNDILTGVQCSNCKSFHMERERRKWNCPNCKQSSTHDHVQAILDYFLLISPTITNKKCREWLRISSRKISENILRSMNLIKTGSNKGTIYKYKK